MNETGHGVVGTHEQFFSRLLSPSRQAYEDDDLFAAAKAMDLPDTVGDGPDAEENLYVPAGYTYLGQFVDHDLTLDTTSTLNPNDPTPPTNLRTPAFDLDCVYGDGPAAQPYLYEPDGATLKVGWCFDDPAKPDLIRNQDADGKISATGRAIIGDKRNDENSIVSQIQLAFIKYHNAMVKHFSTKNPGLKGAVLFSTARQEVRWSYQRMLVEDYLKRIIEKPVYQQFASAWAEQGDSAYKLYPPELRSRIPLEFAGAAYRFGHSMVRIGYRMNTTTALPVFEFSGVSDKSLAGFQPLPSSHVIDDWGRFFPAPDRKELWPGVQVDNNTGQEQIKVSNGGRPVVRLQFAYKIDPSLTGSLGDLPASISDFDGSKKRPLHQDHKGPALSLLNLRRGNKFQLASGQRFAEAIGVDQASMLKNTELKIRVPSGDKWTFEDFPAGLRQRTPLWLYILAEAQRGIVRAWADPNGNKSQPVTEDFFMKDVGAWTQLGPVGGRIVMETFFGLLDADPRSYINAAPVEWKPVVFEEKPHLPLTFSRILHWTGLQVSDAFGV
ncbi:peroxidase family protein [Undibacterium sp. TJN25]|uniref:peroxidase family protein n=1 Tax=Undibacterium sp. TJN25 TaxID=3413056 RepID=UPI003BEFADA2